MKNSQKLIALIAKLIDMHPEEFFAIGGDIVKMDDTKTAIDVWFDNGDSDVVIHVNDQKL